MSFRKSKSRKHVPLPITGHTLVEIGRKPFIWLMFASPDGLSSQLRLEYGVSLTNPDGSAEVLAATMPGPTYDLDAAYEALSPLLNVVVKEAAAHANGELDLTFYEGYGLQVHPDNGDAWHFQQPAPSTKRPYPKQHISLSGYGGGLV